ncbi:lipase/acylhydrolase family protein [Lachnospiraceae bacterium KM106-2]|nr:lipase/acylhydrolase family protein [Lachnospiraceae bacterium KM106-2]
MEKVILFQGDSITDGNRLKGKENEWDLNHQMGHGYAYIINALLGEKYPEKYYKFYNRGITANRIVDIYGRWVEDSIQMKPDILSVLAGINDCWFTVHEKSGSSPERFKKIYRLMLEESLEANPDLKIVLCEPFILPVGDVKKEFDLWKGLVTPLQEKVRELSEEFHTVFVPLQDKFNELCEVREPSYWIWDGMHPTVCGHQVLAKQWLECTKDIL